MDKNTKAAKLQKPASTYMKRMYTDTVSPHSAGMKFAIDYYGIDNVMYGTDYPCWDPATCLKLIDELGCRKPTGKSSSTITRGASSACATRSQTKAAEAARAHAAALDQAEHGLRGVRLCFCACPRITGGSGEMTGFPKYNFIGGHNDADQLPVDELMAAAEAVLRREGATLATYGLNSGPLGYRPLRDFLVAKLKRDAGIICSAEEILITSGSLQAIDLVNGILLAHGDSVLIEEGNSTAACCHGLRGLASTRSGSRSTTRAYASTRSRPRSSTTSAAASAPSTQTIPTVQNHDTIMGEPRRRALLGLAHRYGVPIFEDDCYADLIWDGRRPPALYAMSERGGVIHIGSFSKSVAPALRVGYIVAGWDVLARMLALKTDAGSGRLEDMLCEYCARHFHDHVPKLRRALRAKLEVLMDALSEHFGNAPSS